MLRAPTQATAKCGADDLTQSEFPWPSWCRKFDHRRAAAVEHTNARALVYLANSYMDIGRYSDAVDYYHKPKTNRMPRMDISVEMCDMHLVIFLAKKYKTESRTSTNRTESVEIHVASINCAISEPPT